ncbi:MAG: outer membrane protein assembly factor BamB family protein [Planctomycetota bacterium]
MRNPLQAFVALAPLMALCGSALAEPTITELNRSEFPRSGRVAFIGTGFGSSGQAIMGGLEAWTTTWTDTRVVAYIPEQTALGNVSVHLVVGGQNSNTMAITVTERQPDGRIRWNFEVDNDDQWWRPALAPDGTIYIHANNETDGLVYALSPDGGLKWVRHINWYPYAPPYAGPDGAVYAGSVSTMYRISPEGNIDWTYSGLDVQGSPVVGPDGLVYGAMEVSPGAFALDPSNGQEEWINDTNMSAWGMSGNEIKPGHPGGGEPADRFYVSWDAIWAFSLDGDLLFVTGTANTLAHEPAIGSDGAFYTPGYLENYLVAFSPDDGSILWQTDDDWLASISDIEIGPDDTLYFVSDGRWVHAYNPHAQQTVWRHDTGIWLGRPSLSPDGTTLVVAGGGFQDQLEFAKGFSTDTGQEIWNVNFQEEYDPNFRYVPRHHPRISADNTTAYVPTWTAQWPYHDGDPRSLLFAVDITEQGMPQCAVDADCDDANECTDDSCSAANMCVHTNNSVPCDDQNVCTFNDACAAGACSGLTFECDDGNACTDDSCDSASGCINTNNAAPCDDGDTCTEGDACSAGACQAGTPDCTGVGCEDCNGNTRPDACDIADGVSVDANENGVPDECESTAPSAPTVNPEGSRYLAVTPSPDAEPVAIVILGDAEDPAVACFSLYVQEDGSLDDQPVYQFSDQWGTVHVHGEELLPETWYETMAERDGTHVRSPSAQAVTWPWGDVNDDGTANFADVLLIVLGFQDVFDETTPQQVDLAPCMTNGVVNFEDIQRGVQAFQQSDYPCASPCTSSGVSSVGKIGGT